jgi:hypothetical protein
MRRIDRRGILLVLLLGALLVLSACGPRTGSPGEGLHAQAPDLIGLPVGEAQARIVDAGYDVGSVTTRQGEEDAGVVVSQNPAPGTSLARGGEIDLTVSD